MSCDGNKSGPRLFRTRMVRGRPYHVGRRTLIPVARVISFGKARGSIGTERVSGWGLGWNWVIPVAFVEETDKGERRFPIHDATADALRRLFGTAVALTLGFASIRWLVRRWRVR